MNIKMVWAVLALTAVSVPAVAQDFGPRGGFPGFRGGDLTEAERTELMQARFAEADADGDGVLSAEEMQAAAERAVEERRQARVERMIAAADTDGDGALSLEEMQAPRRGNLFDRLDEDGDGTINREEFESMPERRGPGRRHPHG